MPVLWILSINNFCQISLTKKTDGDDVVSRGLITISILKRLEELSHRRIYELFDYICGVSTGSLIGIMAAVFRVPVQDMEEIYKEFSVQMFERNRLVGAGKLFMSHAYYDTALWENILKCVKFLEFVLNKYSKTTFVNFFVLAW